MQSATFSYIEDYIEYIAGLRSANDRALMFFEKLESPISLARYDVKIIESLALQTSELRRPYTDKQSELAITLIKKYVRQLSSIGIQIPESFTNFRYGIRQIDRTKKLYIENDKLILKFPYDTKLLTTVRKYTKESHGHSEFDHDTKLWTLSLTEPMLNWTMTLATANQFEVDNEVKELYDQMLAVEQSQYQIELMQSDDLLYIENGEQSLVDYIENNLGGFSEKNLLILIDNAPVLGYTVNDALGDIVKKQYPEFYKIFCSKQITLSKHTTDLNQLLDYARLTQRLPVYVYDTGLNQIDTDEVRYLNKTTSFDISPKLLITKTAMMIGPKKQNWLAKAEKTIILE